MKLKLENLGSSCPSQWEGTTESGNKVYVRYRWGNLRVEINNKTLLTLKPGRDGYGYMSNAELAEILAQHKIKAEFK
jgi:hypothetical protein